MLTAAHVIEGAVVMARFGRIDGDRGGGVGRAGGGVPRFKLKTDDGADIDEDRPRYRDSHQPRLLRACG